MTWGFVAVAGATVVGSAISSNAAKKASGQQAAAAQAGIDEQQRQFEKVQELLKPYVDAGGRGLAGYEALLGTQGVPAQQAAINAIQGGPEFASMFKQGENAILQNASATGGLRGGNTQSALAQFRPQLLSQLINQQYQRLGGLTSIGQNAAAGVGNAGMQTGQGVSGLLQQQGAAQAGGALAGANAFNNSVGGIGQGLGYYAGQGGFRNIGGAQPASIFAGSGMGSNVPAGMGYSSGTQLFGAEAPVVSAGPGFSGGTPLF